CRQPPRPPARRRESGRSSPWLLVSCARTGQCCARQESGRPCRRSLCPLPGRMLPSRTLLSLLHHASLPRQTFALLACAIGCGRRRERQRCVTAQVACQRAYCRILQQCHDRQIGPHCCAQSTVSLKEQQRVAAQIEEVVIERDPL